MITSLAAAACAWLALEAACVAAVLAGYEIGGLLGMAVVALPALAWADYGDWRHEIRRLKNIPKKNVSRR